jgi:hypothetical protein
LLLHFAKAEGILEPLEDTSTPVLNKMAMMPQ